MTRNVFAGAAALLLAACSGGAEQPEAGPKPELHLLTSLPLMWSEEFAIEQTGSPALDRLRQDYRVIPIDLPSELPAGGMLLAAQPRALPAEELVALDAWVRGGGRMLLLADPLLEWPSELPLGDAARAPPMFADTGLLAHWGLRLDAPDAKAPVRFRSGSADVTTLSPGRLVRMAGDCTIRADGIVAECAIGKGHARIVADADWLDDRQVKAAGGSAEDNHFALLVALSPPA